MCYFHFWYLVKDRCELKDLLVSSINNKNIESFFIITLYHVIIMICYDVFYFQIIQFIKKMS
jgi:hypothetical protein